MNRESELFQRFYFYVNLTAKDIMDTINRIHEDREEAQEEAYGGSPSHTFHA